VGEACLALARIYNKASNRGRVYKEKTFRESQVDVGRLCEKIYKNDRTRNKTERSCRRQGHMAMFVFSGMVLKVEIK
jgi:hypothetical protein